MERERSKALLSVSLCKLKREENIGQFTLSIPDHFVVLGRAEREIRVVKSDGAKIVCSTADIHDTRHNFSAIRCLLEIGQQEACKKEVAKVVAAELALESILGFTDLNGHRHRSIVDQDLLGSVSDIRSGWRQRLDAYMDRLRDLLRRRSDRGGGGDIKYYDLDVGRRGLLYDGIHAGLRPEYRVQQA